MKGMVHHTRAALPAGTLVDDIAHIPALGNPAIIGPAGDGEVMATVVPIKQSAGAPAASGRPIGNTPESIATQARLMDTQAIFGTSARNAYKVYFPQIEQAGKAVADVVDRDQDLRVLAKKGDYLFFEEPASSPTSAGDAALIRAATKAARRQPEENDKAPEKAELTAPVLQKQPLDFSGGLSKEKPLPESSSPIKIPAGDMAKK